METTRLNPVTLITGAASGMSTPCLRDLARRSQGGLILVDLDEAALSAAADDLEMQDAAPERVSTLAFDVTDKDRWDDAAAFIETQYGRIDWAVVYAGTAQAPETGLVDFRGKTSALDGVVHTLRATMPIMRRNQQGGAIVVNASAEAKAEPGAGKGPLGQMLRAAAKEGAQDNIRVNAVAPGAGAANAWSKTPWFNDLVRDTGSADRAFAKIAKMATPMARYAHADDIGRLIVMLLSDDSPMTGATLVVDGGQAQ
jgi:NAD(P)-dependent dehydrogenase (short-subunit alcohol dehydrogenase family)